jgi:integrase
VDSSRLQNSPRIVDPRRWRGCRRGGTSHGSPREVSRKFTGRAGKAGLKISLHDLRRSFGSRYASAVTAPVWKRLMRHADIKTTLAYYTDVADALIDAILKA